MLCDKSRLSCLLRRAASNKSNIGRTQTCNSTCGNRNIRPCRFNDDSNRSVCMYVYLLGNKALSNEPCDAKGALKMFRGKPRGQDPEAVQATDDK